jgi:predicted peptidase
MDGSKRPGFLRILVVAMGVMTMAACTTAVTPSGAATDSSAPASATSPASAQSTHVPSPEWRASDTLTAHPIDETDAPLGFLEYLPPGYGDGEAVPLLVALHGFDGSGDGSSTDLQNLFETGIPQMIQNDDWPEDRPFVVLMPQHDSALAVGMDEPYSSCDDQTPWIGSCVMEVQHSVGSPAGGSLCMTPAELHDFIAWAISAYVVDADRVYLTGLSCGGFAAYEYAAEFGGSQIAAMVPIAADARGAWEVAGCDLGLVPIWAFQGDADDVVRPSDHIDPLNALADCPQPPRQDVTLTAYPGVDHDSWGATYDLTAGNDIYAWLLDHKR